MSEWTGECMDVTKKPTSEGWSGSWTLVWSLSLFSCGVSLLVVFLSFRPVVLEKRRGWSENPADMKTVRYCFVTFFPLISFLNPLLSSTMFSVKPLQSCRYDTKSFFFVYFLFLSASNLYDGRGKKDVWMKASVGSVSRTSLLNTYTL